MKKKITAFFLGLCFAATVLETLLRIPEFFHDSDRRTLDRSSFKILTLGNSHTFGLGADPAFTYPAQLESSLKKTFPCRSISVINPARPNMTTALILQELPQLLQTHRPDAVYVMAGEPNIWNSTGYSGHVSSRLPELKTLRIFRYLFLQETNYTHNTGNTLLNAYRWIPYLLMDPSTPVHFPSDVLEAAIRDWKIQLKASPDTEKFAFLAWVYSIKGDHINMLESVKASMAKGEYFYLAEMALDKFSDDSRAAKLKRELLTKNISTMEHRQITDWIRTGKLSEKNAEKLLRRTLSTYPYHVNSIEQLWKLLLNQGRYLELAEIQIWLLNRNPLTSRRTPFTLMNIALKRPMETDLREKTQRVFDQAADEFRRDFPGESARIHQDTASIHDWTLEDLRRITSEIRNKNVPVFLQTYPPDLMSANRSWVDNLILEVGKAESVPVLDTYSEILKEVSPEHRFGIFSSDRKHLNERGYALISRQMLNHIVQNFGKDLDDLGNAHENTPCKRPVSKCTYNDKTFRFQSRRQIP